MVAELPPYSQQVQYKSHSNDDDKHKTVKK